MQLITLAVLFAVLAAAFGFAVGTWVAVVPAGSVWPLYVLGLKQSWWGHGVGDGWEYALIVITAALILGSATGVLFRARLIGPPRRAASETQELMKG
ncbi:MAG: hypothetical protein M3540_11040 [Actinomycetota bacterium]|nr:hypothetical protein [Actinomycetota bacterium]